MPPTGPMPPGMEGGMPPGNPLEMLMGGGGGMPPMPPGGGMDVPAPMTNLPPNDPTAGNPMAKLAMLRSKGLI